MHSITQNIHSGDKDRTLRSNVTSQGDRVAVGINTEIVGKTYRDAPFVAQQLTRHELAQIISQGHAFSPVFRRDDRRAANFIETSTLALDFDDGTSLDDLTRDLFITRHASILYETWSSTPAAPRSRAVFFLDRPATYDEATRLIRVLHSFYPNADQATKNPSGCFYGTRPDAAVRVISERNTLSVSTWLNHPAASLTAGQGNPSAPPTADEPTKLSSRVDPAIAAEIAHQLGVTRYTDTGWSNKVICPFHNDHNPSAAWNKDKGILRCHACGQHWKAKEVAAKLGIPWRSSTRSNGLSNTARETLLQAHQGTTARVLDAAIIQGASGRSLSMTEAVDVFKAVGIGRKAIDATMTYLATFDEDSPLRSEGREDPPTNAQEYFPVLTDSLSSPVYRESCHFGKKLFDPLDGVAVCADSYGVKAEGAPEGSKRGVGRPTKIVTFPTPRVLDELLDVSDAERGISDPLPADAFASNKTYRIAIHEARLRRGGATTVSTSSLGARIGVSAETIYRYERQMRDLVRTPNFYNVRKITPEQLPDDPHVMADSLGVPLGLLVIIDGKTERVYPPTVNGAIRATAFTGQAYLATRGASTRTITPQTASDGRQGATSATPDIDPATHQKRAEYEDLWGRAREIAERREQSHVDPVEFVRTLWADRPTPVVFRHDRTVEADHLCAETEW